MITLMEAIEQRHSVRSYTDEPIVPEAAERLQHSIDEVNEEGNVSIQLVLDEPDAFTGFKARYGKFSNVRNYLALVGPDCKELDEALGYGGEKLVLLAQQLGLNTCWVGSTYKVVRGRYSIQPHEKLAAVIALGHGVTAGAPRKSAAPETVAPGYGKAPDWFRRGVDAALLAPTALNQQKFRFTWEGAEIDGVPLVRSATKRGPFARMDLGIAKLHFEIGAGDAGFAWD